MLIKEKKSVISDIATQIQCDACGKKIKNENDNNWFFFSGYHGDWGNDSVDSNIYYDACCVKCYIECLKKALEEFTDNKSSAEIDNKSYDCVEMLVNHMSFNVKNDAQKWPIRCYDRDLGTTVTKWLDLNQIISIEIKTMNLQDVGWTLLNHFRKMKNLDIIPRSNVSPNSMYDKDYFKKIDEMMAIKSEE